MKIRTLSTEQALAFLDAACASRNLVLSDEAMQAVENCPLDPHAALRSIFCRFDSGEVTSKYHAEDIPEAKAWFSANHLEL